MKLFISGDINEYYAQTLCMIFFPGAKFSETEELTEDSDVLSLTVVHNENGVIATAEMKSEGKASLKEHFEPYREGITKQRTAKIASGIAVVAAGKEIFNCTPPWGILTGVRPAKLMSNLIKQHGELWAITYFTDELQVSQDKTKLALSVACKEEDMYSNNRAW